MRILEQVLQKTEPISVESIQRAFEDKMTALGYEGVTIEDVDFDMDGYISVLFADEEGDALEALFVHDEEWGSVCIISGDEGEDDNAEDLIIELDSLEPPIKHTSLGKFIDLSDLSWMTKSLIDTIFRIGDIDSDEFGTDKIEKDTKDAYAAYGFFHNSNESLEDCEIICERKITVIRGGKKVRLPVVRKIRRRIMTGKQRASIRKAVRKRKMKQARINRKRMKSLRIRKRVALKTPKLGKFQKAAGTANIKVGR